jgi:hypothetical protein
MARELHRWPSPWRPILKPCQFAVKGEPDGASQTISWAPDRALDRIQRRPPSLTAMIQCQADPNRRER